MRVSFEQLYGEFQRVLTALEFSSEKANTIAGIFAHNSLDGVYSHGLNRFPTFVNYVKDGLVRKDAEPVCVDPMGAIERWDGGLGPGMLNASIAMDRAIALSELHGLGCVALRNTNHWMRGGTYGWQAAEAGYIGLCFTNTIANIPPWGGLESRLGNNPLVIAVPRAEGHVVLDMAMSQFAFGKISRYHDQGEQLPFDGGYDDAGNMTNDPAVILETMRGLPIGFWKGSGLSLMLDLLASLLSGGRSTGEISAGGKEYGVSQVFLAIRPGDLQLHETIVRSILDYTRSAVPREGQEILYPGEQTRRTRDENKRLGIPVDEKIWRYLCENTFP